MATTTSFNCTYQDGTILTDQDVCPDVNASGSPLTGTEVNLSTDVVSSPFPWWLLGLVLLLVIADQQRQT
jgi:hypothetical protein